MDAIDITLFGRFQVTKANQPVKLRTRKVQALLLILAVHPDRPHSRDWLMTLLWPEETQAVAQRNLRQTLYHLRKALSSGTAAFAESDRQRVWLNDAVDLSADSIQFQRLLAAVSAHPHDDIHICASCRTSLARVADLYAGELADGFYLPACADFEQWLTSQRSRLREQALDALETLTAAQLEAGDLARAEASARRQVTIDELREGAYRQLMTALAVGGRRDEALQVYDQCRQVLWDALGIAPNEHTRALEQQISVGTLRGTLATVPLVQSAESRNPYKGLQPFTEADAGDFFGRNTFIDHLIEQLRSRPFLAVVGPSGSGKSSVVAAGLLPAIHAGVLNSGRQWRVATMTPGADPQPRLDEAVSSSAGQQTLLFVDQLEETYTLCRDTQQQKAFLNRLVALSHEPWCRVIVTLRADFFDRPLTQPEIGRIFRDQNAIILPLTAGELASAIRDPAAAVGVRVEPELVATLIADVTAQPGALPLLQYTLTELFDLRANASLTLESYQTLGGVSGAVGRRAESIFSDLDDDHQHIARQLFLRLVITSDGNRATGRRVQRAELESLGAVPTVKHVLGAFGRYRLLTFGTGASPGTSTVELAHEALLRAWPRLADWIESARDDLRRQNQLNQHATEWLNADSEPSFLLHGSRLATFEAWVEQSNIALSALETTFLSASISAHNRQHASEAARRQRELRLESRSRQFLQLLAVVLMVTTIGALAVTAVVVQQRNMISAERDRTADNLELAVAAQATSEVDRALALASERDAREAYSLSLAVAARQALVEGDTVAALSLAYSAAKLDDPPLNVLRALRETAFAPGAAAVWGISETFNTDATATQIAFLPDGEHVILGFDDGILMQWRQQDAQTVQTYPGHEAAVSSIVVSPDGTTLFSADIEGHIHAWNIVDGTHLFDETAIDQTINALALSPDGALLIAGGGSTRSALEPGRLSLLDSRSGVLVGEFGRQHRNAIERVLFTPDGLHVLAASGRNSYMVENDNDLILWDIETYEPIRQFETSEHDNRAVALHPTDPTFLTGATNHGLYRFRIDESTADTVIDGHENRLTAVAFTPDGNRLVTATDAGSVFLWDADSAELVARLLLHEDEVTDITMHPRGDSAMTISADGMLVAWDLTEIGNATRIEAHDVPALDVAFLPDGRHVVTSSGRMTGDAERTDNNSLRLWDIETGEIVRTFEGHSDSIFQFIVAPDGATLVSTSYDKTIRVWDTATGEQLQRMWANAILVSADYAPTAPLVAVGGLDGSLTLYDMAQAVKLKTLAYDNAWPVWAVDFSADGSLLLSGSDDGIRLYDVVTGQQLAHWVDHEKTVTSVIFSPDGTRALSSGNERTIHLWDVTSGTIINSFPGHQGVRTRLAFLPDGEHFVSSGWDGQVVVRLIESGEVVQAMSGHKSTFIMDVATSPDGQHAATVGVDGQSILWRITTITDQQLPEWIEANRFVQSALCEDGTSGDASTCVSR